jgi:phosphoribosyl-dephospho-CoA transferase
MDVKPHDLLKLKGLPSFLESTTYPDWVKASILHAPYVVVRRAPLEKNQVPVGIRGQSRSERFAAFLQMDEVEKVISPEMLVYEKKWETSSRLHEIKVLQDLHKVDQILTTYQLNWGPVGSVGFELTSGMAALTINSDLDLVVRTPKPMPIETAKRLFVELSKLDVRIDVQLETPQGAIALSEYCRENHSLLLRTLDGPVLTTDSWSAVAL